MKEILIENTSSEMSYQLRDIGDYGLSCFKTGRFSLLCFGWFILYLFLMMWFN